MLVFPKADPIPLTIDANGVVRISKSRVTLDTVVTAFLKGVQQKNQRAVPIASAF
jgi:biopolymer transport protein ExbD